MHKLVKSVILLVSSLMIFSFVSAQKGQIFTLCDFESPKGLANIGGSYGAWNRFPEDFTQNCATTLQDENGNKCVKITYDVDSPNPAYNGFFMQLNGIDFSGYDYLVISVKGDAKEKFTTQTSLELKNDKKQVGVYLLTGITSQWQEFKVPLNKFEGNFGPIDHQTKMNEFVIVFDDIRSTAKRGAIYIDDVYLMKGGMPEEPYYDYEE